MSDSGYAGERAAPPEQATHRPVVIAFHWLTALALAATVGVVLVRDLVDVPGADRLLMDAHKALGSGLLALVLIRLVSRFLAGVPKHGGLGRMTQLAASAIHTALYGALIVVPLMGWLTVNFDGRPVRLLWLIDLPHLVPTNLDLGDTFGDVHSALAWTFLTLIGLHAAAALWHHFARRDGILISMLPLAILRRGHAFAPVSDTPASERLEPPKLAWRERIADR
jgi:cytochrome b561